MNGRFLTLSIVLLMAVACRYAVSGDVTGKCDALPLLTTYEKAGLVQRTTDGSISVRLVADLHSADCGAPDCYGTKITMVMKPEMQGRRCVMHDVVVDTIDYAEAGCGPSERTEKHRREAYIPEGGGADLADPSLKKLILRSRAGSRAILLLPDDFFYFDTVTRDGTLRTRLLTEDDNEDDCCWGATSSHFRFRR